jgi:hypothetical protein
MIMRFVSFSRRFALSFGVGSLFVLVEKSTCFFLVRRLCGNRDTNDAVFRQLTSKSSAKNFICRYRAAGAAGSERTGLFFMVVLAFEAKRREFFYVGRSRRDPDTASFKKNNLCRELVERLMHELLYSRPIGNARENDGSSGWIGCNALAQKIRT